MQVIGWTTATTAPDDRFDLMGRGSLRTVLAPLAPDAGQPERLKAMVACFVAGLDFVPLSPSVSFTATQADHLARQHGAALARQIAGIRGHGQMTVMLSAPARLVPKAQAPDGRAWLQSRVAQHASVQAQLQTTKQALDCIVAALPYRIHRSEPRGGRYRCDVLVPRDGTATFCDQLRASMPPSAPCVADFQLTLCGLWPAFHFCQVPDPADAHV